MPTTNPIASGPLISAHQHAQATLAVIDGWQIAVRYPNEPMPTGNALIDLSHWPTYEINGPQTGATLQSICGSDVPLRHIHQQNGLHIYRLTDRRAILFDTAPRSGSPSPLAPRPSPFTIDVTGGWASIALIGPDAETILAKVTAVDLRQETLPPGTCCQGPLFGVNTLFGRFGNRFELHVCTDSTEFFWEVLLDAGREFKLAPAGAEYHRNVGG